MGSEMLFTPRKQDKMMKSNNFTQTCNRFSQFLKERRSLGHLDSFKKAKDVTGLPNKMENERVSLELFPFLSSSTGAAVESSSKVTNTKDMTNTSELPKSQEEHKNTTTPPSMTIFYGGKVLVFDELTEDKAREVMDLASRGTMSSQVRPQTQTHTHTHVQIKTRHLTQDVVPQGGLSDLPIARRVSLHRFMEKRKHRVASSAPYQLQKSSMPVSDYNSQNLNMMRSLYEKEQLDLNL